MGKGRLITVFGKRKIKKGKDLIHHHPIIKTVRQFVI